VRAHLLREQRLQHQLRLLQQLVRGCSDREAVLLQRHRLDRQLLEDALADGLQPLAVQLARHLHRREVRRGQPLRSRGRGRDHARRGGRRGSWHS